MRNLNVNPQRLLKSATLSIRESATFVRLEDVIATAERWRADAAKALVEIRDRRLFRAEFESFDSYVRERWGWERSRAYQMCQFGELLIHLSTKVDSAPTRESHARPLYPLQPSDQIKAWREVLLEHGCDPRTEDVERIALRYRVPLSRSHAGIIPYCGSKAAIVPHILPHLPSHEVYVETHGGSATVLLGKPRSKIEVLNDRDDALVNFFRVLRERQTELVAALRRTPFALAEWRFCRNTFSDPVVTELERARRYYVRVCQSFAGFGEKFNRSTHKPHAQYWRDRVERLDEAAERLRAVVIESLDATDCIAKYASAKTVFYVDPPFVKESRSILGPKYRCDMADDDHTRLIDALSSTQAKVLLSGGESALYSKRLKGWRVCGRFRLPCGTGGSKVGRYSTTYRTELLWANF